MGALVVIGGIVGAVLILGGDDEPLPPVVQPAPPADDQRTAVDPPEPPEPPDDPDPPVGPTGGLTAQELGERFGDAVWRVEVDGCGQAGSGTGFAIAPDLFVTNAHVVNIDATPSLVSRRGETISGTVIGLSDWPDLAVIEVASPVDTWLEWAPTDELVEGQPVTALSYPTPLLRFSVAPGTLMSFQVEGGQRIAIASDEVTDYGSSGGPLLDDQGRVAGVVTEFASGDGRQLVGLSYTYAFLQSHLEEMVADRTPVVIDCSAIGMPGLPPGWDAGPGFNPDADGYGSDPGLDLLWDACADGSMAACDDLYRYSPLNSGYEAFGDSCGERNPPAGWCVDIYGEVSGDVGGTYGSDAFLDSLWDACAAGDYEACDVLFIEAPIGSPYQAFGDSCGERNEPAGWCRDIYG